MIRCGGCGYDRSTHDPITLKCHPATADKNGRRGQFKPPVPPDTRPWRERIAADVAARHAAIEAARAPYVPVVVPPPQVPARPPQAAHEFAGYGGRQAAGLGRAAAAAGWDVAAFYWRGHNGAEGCAVKMRRGDLRAVATWTRKPGGQGKASGWAADVAYGWKLGTMPAKVNHTDLKRIFSDVSH